MGRGELEEFHEFVARTLRDGGSTLSPESVLAQWRRVRHDDEDVSLLRASLAEADEGQLVPAADVLADLRDEFGLGRSDSSPS